MGVPHPESYIIQCLAIKRNWKEIKRHCGSPNEPVSRIFVQKMSDETVFRMNYKGKDRLKNEEADIRLMTGSHFVVRADISTCFPGIYTHSIPWAIHGKGKSKNNKSILLPGNLLDNTAQCVRDRQTNGIMIGPHASNVISEIILTRIDDVMIKKGYKRFIRYIDDYAFYAKTYGEAEDFIRDLRMILRDYELSLNGRKTEILSMPLPIEEDWVRELNRIKFPKKKVIRFNSVRPLMDLALNLAQGSESYSVLNYAIKMIPPRLNSRAKRLFVQESINLALIYPYLARILGEHVFDKHGYEGIEKAILKFVEELIDIGIKRIYSDAIIYGLYYALKYDLRLGISEENLLKIVDIDDCICSVLLLEYSRYHKIDRTKDAIRRRANKLKSMEIREQDRHWLLIYQLWRDTTLESEGQSFLAQLKRSRFQFVRLK